MKAITLFLLACISLTANIASAAIYHGIFAGTVDNLSEFAPFSDGDAFTLRLEVDTTSSTPTFLELNIDGTTGLFPNSTASIFDNEFGTQDRFQVITNLDDPSNIFGGQGGSNVGLEFIGGTGIFSGTGLGQAFNLTDFSSVSGSFDVGFAQYSGDLLFTSGTFTAGSLPPVPVPSALWLFSSGLIGLIGATRHKKAT